MPEETKALFARTFDTGIEHGTVTVLLEGEGFEVTTYRIDGKYEDSRHPTEVTFTRNLREDLLRDAYELGITKIILPEFDRIMETEQETPHHRYSVGEHTLYAMKNVRPDKVLRLAMLLHDMGKPALKTMGPDGVAHFKKHAAESRVIAKDVMRRLKFDNDTLNKVAKLVEVHDYRMPAAAKNVRRAMNQIGEDLFPLYLEVRRADVLAQSMYQREEKIRNLDEIESLYQAIKKARQCVSLADLAVTGRDLIEAGMKPGKEIGDKLQELLELVIEAPELNVKEELLKKL